MKVSRSAIACWFGHEKIMSHVHISGDIPPTVLAEDVIE